MAVVTNTFQSTSAVGNREDLSDIVSRITPQDTPIYSMIGKTKCTNTRPEWEIDALRAPAANAQLEGDEYAYSAITVPTRVSNRTQIFREGWVVSKTQEAIDNAGSVEKIAEQKVKSAIHVRKDIELAIVSNTASVGGATRVLGGLPSWLTTNVSRGATGANGGYSSGTGLTVAATNGTQRAFTKALLDTVMQSGYQNGADFSQVIVSPYVKSVFVTFMSDTNVAAFRYAADGKGKNTIVGTADVYEGPFGKVLVTPNRVMAASAGVARNVFLLTPDYLKWGNLRPIQEDPNLAKTGDATKGMILGEGTLEVLNEGALGVVADVFGLTASS
ncbi:head protein [Sinorhizobium meliloti]|uniref:DUF5309 domain-containing protein n=1 Tax=Rhizobium meliloti TaxID=382 RepID=UPI000FDAD03B|nr:DUF5309 domain-containing protein [Sinorhizobium meliloti]RVH87745.1 head protein [Sinorhizobium meliloti]